MNHGPPNSGPRMSKVKTYIGINDIGHGGLGVTHSAGPPISTPTTISTLIALGLVLPT